MMTRSALLLAVVLIPAVSSHAAVSPTASAPASPASASIVASAPSRFATVDGMKVHYKLLGKGKSVLLLIHGWGGNMNLWREQAAYFASRTRVLLVDLPGHGLSDKAHVPYSMRLFATALRGVMNDARVDRAILVAHSMGTPIARQFDRQYHDRTRGIVTLDGALQNTVTPQAANKFIAPLHSNEYKVAVAQMFAAMASAAPPALREEVTRSAVETPQDVLVGAMEAMFLDPAIWNDDKIRVPVLALYTKSPVWSPAYMQYVEGIVPDLDYQIVPDTDHFLMLEKGEEVNQRIDRWLVKKNLLGK